MGGRYDDFSVGWYAYVGVALIATMVIEAITPHAVSLVQELVSSWSMRRAQSKGTGVVYLHKFPNQKSLDEFVSGEQFELQLRYPHVLNGIFVTMLYSAGLPLLLPVLAISMLLTYWVEKYLLLRKYRRPQGGEDETLAMLCVQLLPFALVLHLAASVWIYGNSEVTVSNVINVDWISTKAGMDSEETAKAYDAWLIKSRDWDKIGLVPKIIRNNTFPHFLLLMIVLLVMLVAQSTLPLAAFLRRQCSKLFHCVLDVAEKYFPSYSNSDLTARAPSITPLPPGNESGSSPKSTISPSKGRGSGARVFVSDASSPGGLNATQRSSNPVMLGQMKKGTTRGKKDKHSKFQLPTVQWKTMFGTMSHHINTLHGQRAFASFRQLLQESDSKRCPPFTGVFEQHLPNKQRAKMSTEHQAAGWCLDSAIGGKVLCKKWPGDGVVDGVAHTKGQAKRTWEVLRDWNPSGCKFFFVVQINTLHSPLRMMFLFVTG
jgi:hypothetical protein